MVKKIDLFDFTNFFGSWTFLNFLTHCDPSTEYPSTEYRVPPLPSTSSVSQDEYEDTESVVLYPSVSNVPNVPLDVPVRLMILGSPQVGKSALALRYLTKNQCDNEISTSKYVVLLKN